MRRKTKLIFALGCILTIGYIGCSKNDSNRDEIRSKLDKEFEEKTEKLVKKTEDLKDTLSKLIETHKVLDENHDILDVSLMGKKLSAKEQIMQERHLKWEKQHLELIEKTRKAIESFEKVKEDFDRKEEKHDSATIEQIKQDHEEFNSGLIKYEEKFTKLIKDIGVANEQMSTIFKQHKKLSKKYK